MNSCSARQSLVKHLSMVFIAAALTLLLLGAVQLWAVRGNAILLDLTFTGCF